MGKINVLDKHVAELIAAGEVVERPSSVIKELVENSVDSGAAEITIEIQNGGTTLMRVSDNGSGILRDDIRNAFKRHATSKVKIAEDLDSIGTLGFRGEALASISAVAKVELITRSAADEIGTHYVIEGCDEVLMEDSGCPLGTTFIVKNLFCNVPARMKFLKKNVSEGNAVASVVEKMALSHSEIAFTFIRENKQVLVTSGDGNMKNCIYSVLGSEFSRSCAPVNYELNGIAVKGYVTKPQAARSTRSMENFFINGRFVKSRTASAAIEEACKGMVMTGKFPGCVLHLGITYEAVDVNVHPAKIEVRFVNEKPVFEAVYYAVRSALVTGDTVKQININPAQKGTGLVDKYSYQKPFTMSLYQTEQIKNSMPVQRPSARELPDKKAVRNYGELIEHAAAIGEEAKNNFISDVPLMRSNTAPPVIPRKCNINIYTDDTDKVNVRTEKPTEEDTQAFVKEEASFVSVDNDLTVQEDTSAGTNSVPEKNEDSSDDKIPQIIPQKNDNIKYIGEAFSTYIIIQKNNELILVDKHALHERIIYEKLKKEQGKKFAQYLLEPQAVQLTPEQHFAVIDNKDVFYESGFELDDFGGNTVLVRSAPSFIDAFDIAPTIEEMAEHILQNKKNIESEYTDWLYHNIACRSAVKGGDKSTPEELIKLYSMIEDDPNYRYCPHGRPTSMTLSKYQLEKQFGRIQ